MLTMLNDVQYALRLLRRSPGFAATAIVTLALAIGANTATFSAVKGVLIAPLPYPDPDRLVRLFEESSTLPHFPMAPADFRDYRAELQTFDAIAAYMRADLQIGDASQPEQLRGMQVSSGFFHVLGYQPLFGRDFEPDDEIAGNDNVAILSHALWKRRFNGDPSVVGRTASFSGRTFRIIGVLPDSVRHVGGSYRSYGHGEPVDVWWALPVPREEIPRHRFSHYYNVIGRMKPGVTWPALEEDLRRTRAGAGLGGGPGGAARRRGEPLPDGEQPLEPARGAAEGRNRRDGAIDDRGAGRRRRPGAAARVCQCRRPAAWPRGRAFP